VSILHVQYTRTRVYIQILLKHAYLVSVVVGLIRFSFLYSTASGVQQSPPEYSQPRAQYIKYNPWQWRMDCVLRTPGE